MPTFEHLLPTIRRGARLSDARRAFSSAAGADSSPAALLRRALPGPLLTLAALAALDLAARAGWPLPGPLPIYFTGVAYTAARAGRTAALVSATLALSHALLAALLWPRLGISWPDLGLLVAVLPLVALLIAGLRERGAQAQAQLAAERATAAAAQERLTFLAGASHILADSLDNATTLDSLAHLGVSRLADWCIVDLVEEDGTLSQMALAHSDPQKEAIVRELRRRYPPSIVEDHPIWRALATGQPQLVPTVVPTELATRVHDADHLALLEELRFHSHLVVPLIARGRTLGTISFVAREAERYSAADQELAQDLAERAAVAVDNARLYQAAQAALRSRDEFLSIAAHELKTPLTVLQGHTESLQRRAARTHVLDDRDRRAMGVIRDQSKRLNRLIESLLDLSRLQSGHLLIERRPLDLQALTQRILDELQPTLDQHTLELISDRRPLVVDGDELRLEQALQNLLQNAVKYSPQGGPVTVTLARAADEAVVAVRDQGIGIPAAAQARLFQRFYRASNVGRSAIKGMGIGLYVVNEIVTLHGGSVAVSSVEGQGSTFTIRLPLAG